LATEKIRKKKKKPAAAPRRQQKFFFSLSFSTNSSFHLFFAPFDN
jgi:hypothetical protein